MKLQGFYKDKSAKDKIIDNVTFKVKPLNQAQLIRFEGMMRAGASDIFTFDVKRCFARDHVTGWSGLKYEDKSDVEYSVENAVDLLSNEDYDDLFAALFDFSLRLRRDMDSDIQEDVETAKK